MNAIFIPRLNRESLGMSLDWFSSDMLFSRKAVTHSELE